MQLWSATILAIVLIFSDDLKMDSSSLLIIVSNTATDFWAMFQEVNSKHENPLEV